MTVSVRSLSLVARDAARRWRAWDVPDNLVFITSRARDVAQPEIGPDPSSMVVVRLLVDEGAGP